LGAPERAAQQDVERPAGTLRRVARLDQIHPDNVAGDWYADTRCIACDVARHYAPDLIGADDRGLSVVLRQPGDDEQELELWRAALACPTQSIGTRSRRHAPPGVFPHRLTDEVSLGGYNDESSFGAHSYLVERPAGNLLVDSPRYTRRLVEPFAERGGLAHILLTHQDDVADHRAWAERFGARTWIHEIERHAAPEATDLLEGEEPKVIGPGLVAVPVPGHTRGASRTTSTTATSSRGTPSRGTPASTTSTSSPAPPGTRGPSWPGRSPGSPTSASSGCCRVTACGTTSGSTRTPSRWPSWPSA
jgi:ferredoxin